MFDSSTPASFLSIQPARRGRHDAFLERSLPRWLVDTSVERKIELKNTQPHIPEWYATATDTKKDSSKRYWRFDLLRKIAWTTTYEPCRRRRLSRNRC